MSQRGLMVRSFFPRGLLPSLGAGGSLIGAVVVLGVIVSGFFAVGGWPGTGDAPQGAAVKLGGRAPQQVAAPVTHHLTAAAPVAVARDTAPARQRPVATHRATLRAGARPGTVVAAPRSAPVRSSSPAAPAPPAAKPATTPAPAPSPAPVVRVPSQPVTTVVHTVEQTLPPLPPVVQPVVQTVGSVANGVAQTADGVVGGLLPGQR